MRWLEHDICMAEINAWESFCLFHIRQYVINFLFLLTFFSLMGLVLWVDVFYRLGNCCSGKPVDSLNTPTFVGNKFEFVSSDFRSHTYFLCILNLWPLHGFSKMVLYMFSWFYFIKKEIIFMSLNICNWSNLYCSTLKCIITIHKDIYI